MAVLAAETWADGTWNAWRTTGSDASSSHSVVSGRGRQQLGAKGSALYANARYLPAGAIVDTDVVVSVSPTSAPDAANSVFLAVRATNNDGAQPTAAYMLQIGLVTGTVTLRRRSGGAFATDPLVPALTGVTWAANTRRWFRLQAISSLTTPGSCTVRWKHWLNGETEPADWTQTATDASQLGAGYVALNQYQDGSANRFVDYDDLTVTDGSADGAGTVALAATTTLAVSGAGVNNAGTIALSATIALAVNGVGTVNGAGTVPLTISTALSLAAMVRGTVALKTATDLLVTGRWLAADPITQSATPDAPYLAVDLQPDVAEGVFSLDSSELDGDDLLTLGPDSDEGWENYVCDVQRVSSQRGATRLAGVLTETEAGTLTVVLSDTQRRFDPTTNAGSVHRGTPLRIRAWGYRDGGAGPRWETVMFTGSVWDVRAAYDREDPPLVTLTVADVVSPLSDWKSRGREAPGTGAGQLLPQRLETVLQEVGRGRINAEASDPLALYGFPLAPTTLAGSGWDELVKAATAELGRVWIDARNRLVTKARGAELNGPVRGTLSDEHGQADLGVHCCIADAAIVYGPEQLTNRVKAGRRRWEVDGTARTVTLDNPDSQSRFGVSAAEQTSLELLEDAELNGWAGGVLDTGAEPELRVDSVQPAPWDYPDAWPDVLATDVGDRWLFRVHPDVGPPVIRTLGVLGIGLDITPDGWAITWTTGPAPTPGWSNPEGYFYLDSSELDGGDVLAPFPGIPDPTFYNDARGGTAGTTVWDDVRNGGTAAGVFTDRPTNGGNARGA